jgi:PKD repeat protein
MSKNFKAILVLFVLAMVLFVACPAKKLEAGFAWTPLNPVVGQLVRFNEAATGKPVMWAWKFGDGASSLTKNPSHVYVVAGTFRASLTVSDDSGTQNTKTKAITVAPALVPNFTYSPSFAEAQVEIQFTDTSTGGATSWTWSFGDGGASAIQNPKHTYATSGTFIVTLTASNANGPKVITKPVVVAIALTVDFTWSPLLPVSGQEVQFTDKSTGADIISWLWEFGDGTTSTLQNPKHTFTNTTGTNKDFTVTLTVTNSHGLSASMTASSRLAFPDSVYAPMGFMLQATSPCIGAGTPIPGVTTDFFGLPVDPVHPTIGAVEYHEATPDYVALVRKILEERYRATPAGKDEIDALFLKVYGRAR